MSFFSFEVLGQLRSELRIFLEVFLSSIMSSDSMDDDEPYALFLFNDNNGDYLETCDDEVNYMVPRLERLRINDNEQMDLPSGVSMDTLPRSILNCEVASIADSNYVASPIFVDDISEKIWVNEVTIAAVQSKMSRSETEETSQVFSTNMPVESQSQDVTRKTSECFDIHMDQMDVTMAGILIEFAESVDNANPLDISLKRNSDHNDTTFSSAVSENKTEHQSSMNVQEKMTHVDPETGEIIENLNIICPDTSGSQSTRKAPDQSADEMTSGIILDLDSSKSSKSSKLSYSADISSDDQSQSSSSIMIDYPPNFPDTGAVNASSVEDTSSRNVPPVSGRSKIRKHRFSMFQPPASFIDASNTNLSSDEDSNNSKAIVKNRPIKFRQTCKKTVKFSTKSIAQNYLDVKKENRTSSGKRKKTSSENMTETSEKIRKGSVSEHNSETGENTHLVIRSRSLSPSLKNIPSTSVTNTPHRYSSVSQSRKRTNSEAHNANPAKSRRSSISSDDA